MGDNRTDFDQAIHTSGDTAASTGAKVDEAKSAIRDNAGKVTQQASEKVRAFAEQGKERAGGALDQLSQLLTDAASQVDEKLGAQYGNYARQAATSVQGFSDQVRSKDVDDLVDDARALVRRSPGVAIGAAAAIGFVLARLIQAGLDEQRGGHA
jgi:ElaB/YqjD/DUF883 family membrane-anchored ribosome-binding protein